MDSDPAIPRGHGQPKTTTLENRGKSFPKGAFSKLVRERSVIGGDGREGCSVTSCL